MDEGTLNDGLATADNGQIQGRELSDGPMFVPAEIDYEVSDAESQNAGETRHVVAIRGDAPRSIKVEVDAAGEPNMFKDAERIGESDPDANGSAGAPGSDGAQRDEPVVYLETVSGRSLSSSLADRPTERMPVVPKH